MPSDRVKSTVWPSIAVTVLVACALALGWIVGKKLPLSWKTAPAGELASTADQPAPAEMPLDEQITAVRDGASATIHVESRPIDQRELTRLAELTNLQVLLLDHLDNAIGDEDCRHLAGLQNLIHLRIRGGTIGDDGLAHLAILPQLKILNLPQSRATDRGLAILAEMPRLMQLRLGSRQISDAGMKELSRFPALTQLHLIDAPITDACLDEIARLPKLESLYLDGSRVTDAGLDRLFRARPKLHVHINQQHHDRDPQRGHE